MPARRPDLDFEDDEPAPRPRRSTRGMGGFDSPGVLWISRASAVFAGVLSAHVVFAVLLYVFVRAYIERKLRGL